MLANLGASDGSGMGRKAPERTGLPMSQATNNTNKRRKKRPKPGYENQDFDREQIDSEYGRYMRIEKLSKEEVKKLYPDPVATEQVATPGLDSPSK